MSIIFQLFSAEDLQKLNVTELTQLRDEILGALKEIPRFNEKEGKLHLNLKDKVGPDAETPQAFKKTDGQHYQKWVEEALLKRFHEVSHQLKTPPHDLSQQDFNFETLINKRNDTETQEQE